MEINGFRKCIFVRLSLAASKILNQTINIHIQNHLVEGGSRMVIF